MLAKTQIGKVFSKEGDTKVKILSENQKLSG
jgi:hypothetical protein